MVLLTMHVSPDGLTKNNNKVLFSSVKLVCLTVDSSTTSLSMALTHDHVLVAIPPPFSELAHSSLVAHSITSVYSVIL